MSGYVGLLFREFAVTRERVARTVAADFAHAHANDVRALLKPRARDGRVYRFLERGFDGLLNAYEAGT